MLDGARGLIQRNAPDAILFEILDRPSASPTIRILTEFEYDFYSVKTEL